MAQVGQLGQALTAARVSGYPQGFAEIDDLAEKRIIRLIESALAISEGRGGDVDASPSTICLIGALAGLSDNRYRQKMIDFREDRTILFDNKRIAKRFHRPAALPWPVPDRFYPYPSLEGGRFHFSGGMVAYQDKDRDRADSPFSYVSLAGSKVERRHTAAHESIHAVSSLPNRSLDAADHRGIGLALEEAACDFVASSITGQVLERPAYYNYQLALRQIAEEAGVPASLLADRLLTSEKDNCQIIASFALEGKDLAPLPRKWIEGCMS